MLTELNIKNFAIIDQLQLKFGTGLIAFTGETGAGKSIILDALDTLLGSRAESTFIRKGEEGAMIEATFRIPEKLQEGLHGILEREALLDDPRYVTLSREIRRDSRNVARVNGRITSVKLLSEIGEQLVDIHGQSEHLSLLRVQKHLYLLDQYANAQEALQAYRSTYKELLNVRKELKTLREEERRAKDRIDLLEYQIDEIEKANLESDEEEELKQERDRLANAEKIATLGQEALILLDESTPTNPTITDQLGQVIEALNKLAKLDASQEKIKEETLGAFTALTEVSHDLRLYVETIEFNAKRLDQVEERLELISHLKRKYGDSIADILASGEKAKQTLENINLTGERIEELEAEEEKLLIRLGQHAEALSQQRHQAAEKLQGALETELDDLRMPEARFRVEFRHEKDSQGIPLSSGERVAFDETGHEHIEFFIETNPGEGFKPLVKIASGGETSRLMLALKNVLARADNIPTLIFDEIDQGIGGRVGAIVGYKLWLLAKDHQVLCITHLPQLAAFGHQHFQVQKEIEEGRTLTHANLIEGEDRLQELAQMLGEVNTSTIQSAQEILRIAKEQTES